MAYRRSRGDVDADIVVGRRGGVHLLSAPAAGSIPRVSSRESSYSVERREGESEAAKSREDGEDAACLAEDRLSLSWRQDAGGSRDVPA